MTTTKKSTDSSTPSHQKYDEAVKAFGAAIDMLQRGSYDEARQAFESIERENAEEAALADRAATYRKICEQRLAPDPAGPQDGEGLYFAGVVAVNNGQYDEALGLLERALAQLPDSPKVLYARASAWALKGNAEAAVAELRRAIAADPRIRFQASNDPDFEPIREEPAFIDIIEPTPSGA